MNDQKEGRPHSVTTEDEKNFTQDVLRNLEEAFLNGLSNEKACFLADISPSRFYDILANNPILSERFDQLKNSPKIKAEMNLVDKIKEGDVGVSQWYLERKEKKEFAQRSELTGKDGKDLAQGYVYIGDLKKDDNTNAT